MENRPCHVSILMPIRNEPLEYVDEALETLSKWKFRDYVEIIILSDDPYETYKELVGHVTKWRSKGLNVYVVWRSWPRGFRTGALNTGLWFSRGRYVYVMDVDSRVDEDFIWRAVEVMEKDPSVYAVVARWCGRNRDSRVAEAIASSMEFVVDSLFRGRSASKLPVYPLGTGTLYRSSYLKYVLNGWDEDRLMDDLEIGCRIMGLNGRIVYLDEYCVYVEVPRRYNSLRIQQERWVYGATDVAITRFKHLIRSKQPWYAKFDALYYLLQYLPAITTLIGYLLLSIVIYYERYDVLARYWFIGIPWIVFAATYVKCFLNSLRKRGYSLWRALVNLGRASALTTTLSPVFTEAFFKSISRIKMEYKRTPKGRYEALISGFRFPLEFLTGLFFIVYAVHLITSKLYFSGGWFLTYSLGYVYSMIRWGRELFTRQ